MKIFDTRNQDYVTWNQRSESLVELLDYSATQLEKSSSKEVKLEEMGLGTKCETDQQKNILRK